MTTPRWNIDTAHSAIQFTVRHMVISKVRGAFGSWQATLDFDEENPENSRVSARIDVASIDTREAKRDGHLKSTDFFYAEKHPVISFESKKVEKLQRDSYRILGDLTLRGVTREVELEGEYLGRGKDPWGNERIGFHARASLNRKEFGLTWNQALETGGVLVGEDVEIDLDIQAVRAQEAQQAA